VWALISGDSAAVALLGLPRLTLYMSPQTLYMEEKAQAGGRAPVSYKSRVGPVLGPSLGAEVGDPTSTHYST
jgi:hypothetical protein